MHVGMELVQKADFSVELTQAEFTRQLELMGAATTRIVGATTHGGGVRPGIAEAATTPPLG